MCESSKDRKFNRNEEAAMSKHVGRCRGSVSSDMEDTFRSYIASITTALIANYQIGHRAKGRRRRLCQLSLVVIV
ncbi:hypothetical protein JTE90_013020 [Oedothorax gibbosus]|uniref:Uncharacterized protein n=1 Tax=Oedothorax gibbosus TaxID=931172 RepID=A0AAV6UAI5_9ARAC|nr:hypothetical protein JTE90_013020 [Oedothorax gibbosus]